MEDIYQDFWAAFLEQTDTPDNSYCSRYTYFGNSEEESVEILEQLMRGEKTAISHCVPYYIVTRSPMPKAGEYTMVTDFYGNPCCILRTNEVIIEAVNEVTEELAAQECQGDLIAWRERKQEEFKALAKRPGFHYSEGLPVLMELVDVIFPKK